MAGNLGWSWQPGADAQQGGGAGTGPGGRGLSPQQAIKILSLRIPERTSQGQIAPLPLLTSKGSAAPGASNLNSVVAQLLQAFKPQGGGPAPMNPVPGSGPGPGQPAPGPVGPQTGTLANDYSGYPATPAYPSAGNPYADSRNQERDLRRSNVPLQPTTLPTPGFSFELPPIPNSKPHGPGDPGGDAPLPARPLPDRPIPDHKPFPEGPIFSSPAPDIELPSLQGPEETAPSSLFNTDASGQPDVPFWLQKNLDEWF